MTGVTFMSLSAKQLDLMSTVKNLQSQTAIEKLKMLAENARICHFVTCLNERPNSDRPIAIQKVDENGILWFFSARNSAKNREISKDRDVQLYFSNSSSSEYLSIYGAAEILKDQLIIDELWNGFAKTWFNEGKDDPNLTLIKVTPRQVYYWDTLHNRMVQLIKIAAGALLGTQMDDGREGKLEI